MPSDGGVPPMTGTVTPCVGWMELEKGEPWHWSLAQTFSGKQSWRVHQHILMRAASEEACLQTAASSFRSS